MFPPTRKAAIADATREVLAGYQREISVPSSTPAKLFCALHFAFSLIGVFRTFPSSRPVALAIASD